MAVSAALIRATTASFAVGVAARYNATSRGSSAVSRDAIWTPISIHGFLEDAFSNGKRVLVTLPAGTTKASTCARHRGVSFVAGIGDCAGRGPGIFSATRIRRARAFPRMSHSSSPTASASSEITLLLQRADAGDVAAAEKILPLVYDELRKLAAAKMAREAAGQTLQPTALVHEAWLRLGGETQPDWKNRAHFFAAAAEAMRRILIDRARTRQAERHGGGQQRIDIAVIEIAAAAAPDAELLAVHEALERFAAEDPKKAELVKLRYFAGLTLGEAARLLDIPEGTAKRWWSYSRAWLFRALQPGE